MYSVSLMSAVTYIARARTHQGDQIGRFFYFVKVYSSSQTITQKKLCNKIIKVLATCWAIFEGLGSIFSPKNIWSPSTLSS
jgi:hypothetical protein